MVLVKKDFSGDVDSADKERIHSEQVAIAYKQAFASLFPLFFGASVILFLFYKTSLAFIVTLWFSIVIVTLFWRFWLLSEYRIHSHEHDTKTWERRFMYVYVYLCSTLGELSVLSFSNVGSASSVFSDIFADGDCFGCFGNISVIACNGNNIFSSSFGSDAYGNVLSG